MDAGVATGTVRIAGGENSEQLGCDLVLEEEGSGAAVGGETAFLAEGDYLTRR